VRQLITITCIALYLTACNSSVSSVQDIVSVCHFSTSVEGCEALDNQTVSIRGFLIENEDLNRPHLVSKKNQLDSYNFDDDKFPLSIEILSSQNDFPKYKEFLGREVLVSGQLYTECPPKVAKKLVEWSAREENDVITVNMLTGTCHYVTNPHMVMDAVEIRNIR